MKKLILCFSSALFAVSIFAQLGTAGEEVKKATEEMIALYKLDTDQAAKMQSIQERRFRNLGEIEPLKGQNYKLYLQKRNAIRLGTEGSIERLLTEEQAKIFYVQQAERRRKHAALIKELKQQGASKEKIQMSILEQE